MHSIVGRELHRVLPTRFKMPDESRYHTTQAKHKVSILVHTAKCKFYTERIALASSSKELHQIVNTLSNRHPPKILPTIYPSVTFPVFSSNTLPTKQRNLELTLLLNMLPQRLLLGQLLQLFLHLKKCHN